LPARPGPTIVPVTAKRPAIVTREISCRRPRWLVLAALLAAGLARPAAATTGFCLPAEALGLPEREPGGFRLDLESSGLLPDVPAASPFARSASLSRPSPTTFVPVPEAGVRPPAGSWIARRPLLALGGYTALLMGLEYAAFWAKAEKSESFRFANEGWFEASAYAGGADKASHFVGGYLAGRLAEAGLRVVGTPDGKAQLLSAAMVGIMGALVEVGDAYHSYGFSWEDAVLTAAGGVAGSFLSRTGWDDTITFRYGKVPLVEPADPEIVIGKPDDYAGEVYTLDLRLAGLLPRLGKDPGWARFGLVAVTYGTKGYGGWVQEWERERLLGLEVGLDLYEVGRALGVPPDRWWGAAVLGLLRYVRVPYTAIGFQVDLNSGQVLGPNSFDQSGF
jgi:hypothetical protein